MGLVPVLGKWGKGKGDEKGAGTRILTLIVEPSCYKPITAW
jgi:hypothetical protein